MKRLIMATAVLAVLASSATAEIGAFQVPRHEGMVCDKVEDVRPSNDAWLKLIGRMESVGLSPGNVENDAA
jgi:hypothetical protein